MILRRLKVDAFGTLHPGALVAHFGNNVTVIHGPNESGKSTLLRAITFALYQRHGLGGDEVAALIKPVGRDVTPTVQLDFAVGNDVWRITKSFIRTKTAELEKWDGTKFVREADGSDAEERLRKLIGGDANKKGLAGSELRGIGEILVVDQGALHLPAALGALTRDRLATVVSTVATTGAAHALAAAIKKRYDDAFTPGGAPKKNSAQAQAQAAVDELNARKRDMDDRLRAVEALEAQLSDTESARASDATTAARINAEALDAESRWAAAHQLDLELTTLRRNRDTATADATIWSDHCARLTLLRAQRDAALTARQAAAVAAAAAETRAADARLALATAEAARAARQSTVGDLATARASLAQAREAHAVAARLADQRHRKQSHDAAAALQQRVTAELAAVPRPTATELAAIERLDAEVAAAKADLDRLRLTVEVTADAALKLRHGGTTRPLAAGETHALSGDNPLSLEIPGLARLTIRGPVSDKRDELVRRQTDRTDARRRACLPFGTDDLPTLRDRAGQRRELDRQLTEAGARMTAFFADAAQAAQATLDLVRDQGQLDALVAAHPDWNGTPPDDRTLVAQTATLDERARAEAEAVKHADSLVDERTRARDAAERGLTAAQKATAEADAGLSAAGGAIRQLEDDACADDAARAARTAVLVAAREAATAACEAAQGRRDTLGDVSAARDSAAAARRAFDAERTNRDEAALRADERLSLARRDGLWEQAGAVERELADADEALARAALDAAALARLHGELTSSSQRAVELAVGPVRDRVTRMWKAVSGESRAASFGANLLPDGIATTAGDLLARDLLSAGAQDVLALLTRVALGEIYVQRHGRHVCVLDDPLVNTDRPRQTRVIEILSRATRDLQLVIFTCHPEAYLGLTGTDVVRLAMADAKNAAVDTGRSATAS